MNDNQRKEFEAPFVEEMVARCGEGFRSSVRFFFVEKEPDGAYSNPVAHADWWAWQASRATIIVEWPDQHTYTVPDVAGAAILDCRTAFGKAGFQTTDMAPVLRALLAERNSLAFLLKRFVNGEHDQDENQAERHMYYTEAQNLLAYLGGDLQGHSLVPDACLQAMSADAEFFRWLASQCGEEFEVDVKGVQADGGEVSWALGYEGETCLGQAVQAAMIEGDKVATPSADNENARHEGRQT